MIEPSGQLIPFEPTPADDSIQALEADGADVSVDAITVDGRSGWEMVARISDPSPGVVVLAMLDVGSGAGIALSFSGAADRTGLFQAIVRSVRIDDDRLSRTLATASPP